jgi:pantoate--beta-alanine ligase
MQRLTKLSPFNQRQMIICTTIQSLHKVLKKASLFNASIGFVPTMGALHKGHLSLIELSKSHCSTTVCSIFVNPTQFNDPKDFEKYPITVEKDILLLELAGCQVLFLPSIAEMYPNGLGEKRHYELGYLENLLEGSLRPGHFQGVCQVVHRLLHIVQPNTIFLGQKDYQQCMVINKLLEIIGMEETKLIIGSTLREISGLAMSSRNMRLSEDAKQKATAIFQSLNFIKDKIAVGSLSSIKETASKQIMDAGFEKVDYVSICNAITLLPVEDWDGKEKLAALVAAFIDGIRLIDNIVLN